MKRKMDKIRCGGFTLVELLTTLAVVGILLGLLIPALNQVSKTATRVKQKAQFYAIGTALEAFRNDYGDYPPSEWDGPVYGFYSASQRLAEALVGQDGLGFHSSSQFWEDGTVDMNGDGTPDVIYGDPSTYFQTPADNLASRKGPYLELESANAVKLGAIFNPIPVNFYDTYVLADMYKQVKHLKTGKQIGMPILYYRANKLKIGNEPDRGLSNNWLDNTYNLNDSNCDNFGLLRYPTPPQHFNGDANITANASNFYNAIANPNFTSPPRPYRSESFLLHSAGPDGLYGTTDDMFNFDADN